MPVRFHAMIIALAVAAPASAQSSFAVLGTDVRLDLSSVFGSASRGDSGSDGGVATLETDFESLAPLPAPLAGQLDTVTWGGAAASLTGKCFFAGVGPDAAALHPGVTTDPIAGNATKKLLASAPLTTDGRPDSAVEPFIHWARYEFAATNTTAQPGVAQRFTFRPEFGTPVRIEQDVYIADSEGVSGEWGMELSQVVRGRLVAQTLWNPIRVLAPDLFAYDFAVLTEGRYPPGHPLAGFFVSTPLRSWFKAILEFDGAGNMIAKLDFLDGQGEFAIYTGPSLGYACVDRVSFVASEHTFGSCAIDNVRVSGARAMTAPPPALACVGGMYADNQDWLSTGPLAEQSPRWIDAPTGHTVALPPGGASGNPWPTISLRRINLFGDDHYREETRVTVPATTATPGAPIQACIDLRIPSSFPGALDGTAQGIAFGSGVDEQLLTRIFIGWLHPTEQIFLQRIYVQINPGYNPIDDPGIYNPHMPGPNGNGAPFVIGVDVQDTGVSWSYNSSRRVCVTVDAAGNELISVNGVNYFAGQAFVTTLDHIALESENNHGGVGNQTFIGDITLFCGGAISPPPLLCDQLLPYLDDLEWATPGIDVGLQTPCEGEPGPWTTFAPSAVRVNARLDHKSIELRDLVVEGYSPLPNDPDFVLFPQALTRLPHLEATAQRGWVVRTDFFRGQHYPIHAFMLAEETGPGGDFALVAGLAGEGGWALMPASFQFGPGWFPTGGGGAVQRFSLTFVRSLSGKIHYRIDGKPVRYIGYPLPLGGTPVLVDPIGSPSDPHDSPDALIFLSGSRSTQFQPEYVSYADNIRAWALPCNGDADENGIVDFHDLNIVLGSYGQTGLDLPGNIGPDADNDSIPDDNAVDFIDLNLVLSNYGGVCD